MENFILLHYYHHGCGDAAVILWAFLITFGFIGLIIYIDKISYTKRVNKIISGTSSGTSIENCEVATDQKKKIANADPVEYRIVKEYVCVISAENYGYYHHSEYLQKTVNAFKTKEEAEQMHQRYV